MLHNIAEIVHCPTSSLLKLGLNKNHLDRFDWSLM